VLINQNWISVGVNDHEARGSYCALIGFVLYVQTTRFKLSLKIAHVRERIELIAVFVPTGIEGQNIFLEHSLKQSNGVIPILHYQPILSCVPTENVEP